MSHKIPWQQVRKHTEVGDCWIVIQGKVFDVSQYMKKHPAGRWIIMQSAGKDATIPFQNRVHSQVAFELMTELYLGEIQDTQQQQPQK